MKKSIQLLSIATSLIIVPCTFAEDEKTPETHVLSNTMALAGAHMSLGTQKALLETRMAALRAGDVAGDVFSETFSIVSDNVTEKMSSDPVKLAGALYSQELRAAKKANPEADKSADARVKRKQDYDELQRLSKILDTSMGKYDDILNKSKTDSDLTLTQVFNQANSMKISDQASKEALKKAADDHAKLGALTAKDSDPRTFSQLSVSMKSNLQRFGAWLSSIPESAEKTILEKKLKLALSNASDSQEKLDALNTEILGVTNKMGQIENFDEKGALDNEFNLRRAMALSSLQNSVSNLVTHNDYKKSRLQLAFANFSDMEKEMMGKGVLAGDVKATYKNNIKKIAEQYNNTPIGLYVNDQIAKAISSVCDLVQNQCAEGSRGRVFDFLNDTSRDILKKNEVTPDSKNNNQSGASSIPIAK